MYNFQGSVNVVIDVVGYFQDHNHDDRYYTQGQSNSRYPSKTQTIIVGAAAFAKNTTAANDEWWSSSTTAQVNSGSPFMSASIPIPVGSTITSVRYNYHDNSATDIDFRLNLAPPDALAPIEVAGSEFVSSGGSPDLRTGTVDVNLVVPDHHAVAVTAHAPSWASAVGPVTIRSVELDYILP